MIVPESEASKKLCVDWAMSPIEAAPPMCQGSRCMAWQTTQIRNGDKLGYCGKVYQKEQP